MKIIYYRDKPDLEPYSGLARFIHYELRKKSLAQWEKLDFWIKECKERDSSFLRNMVREEEKKPWENRTLADLKDGLYEYRGKKKSKTGTIRLYFCYVEETLYVLEAEYKTGDKDRIEIARQRKKELKI